MLYKTDVGVPRVRGTAHFGGPYHKDYSSLGSILGSLILGNYHVPLKKHQVLFAGTSRACAFCKVKMKAPHLLCFSCVAVPVPFGNILRGQNGRDNDNINSKNHINCNMYNNSSSSNNNKKKNNQ